MEYDFLKKLISLIFWDPGSLAYVILDKFAVVHRWLNLLFWKTNIILAYSESTEFCVAYNKKFTFRVYLAHVQYFITYGHDMHFYDDCFQYATAVEGFGAEYGALNKAAQ